MPCVKMSYINFLDYMSVTFDKSASKQNQARKEKHHLEDNALSDISKWKYSQVLLRKPVYRI